MSGTYERGKWLCTQGTDQINTDEYDGSILLNYLYLKTISSKRKNRWEMYNACFSHVPSCIDEFN